jgi:hypothetical protein
MDFVIVDLAPACNNRGLQPPGTHGNGAYGFNIWSNTFPAEQLPAPGSIVEISGVPFTFPAGAVPAGAAPAGDNIRCRGQRIPLPPGCYDWIYTLGAAERRTEDEVELHYADGRVRRSWWRMSDFWPETPVRFGEPLAARTTSLRYPRHTHEDHAPAIWQQRIPVTCPDPLAAIVLPDNPAMHLFALSLASDAGSRHAN